VLETAGLTVIDDTKRRFLHRLRTDDDAAQFVGSFYAPSASARARQAALRVARGWAGSEIGLPLRRVTATR
jgi:hypothetical protein